jgi:3-methylfumaryl-CoA hydratase
MDNLRPGHRLEEVIHEPDEVDLFMFSASLWLPHRIHYDRDYARFEGHRDLVVHGPLQGAYLTQMVANWAEPLGGSISIVRYRHSAPSYVGDRLLCTAQIAAVTSQPGRQRVVLNVAIENVDGAIPTTTGTIEVVIPGRRG